MTIQSNLNIAPSGIGFDIMDEYVNRVSHPSPNDVLCGKDKTFQQHPGNQIYRTYISEYTLQYKIAKSNKQEKMRITKQIMNNLKIGHNSRFIRKVDSSYMDLWEEINENEVRDKISHALRFSADESSVEQHDTKKMVSKRNKRDSSMSSKAKTIDTNNQNKKIKAVEADKFLFEDNAENKLVKRYDSIDSVMDDSAKISQHSDNSTLNDMDQLDRQLYWQQQKVLASMRSELYNNDMTFKTISNINTNMIEDKSNQMEEVQSNDIYIDQMIIHDTNVEEGEQRCWSNNNEPPKPSSHSWMDHEIMINNNNNPNIGLENDLLSRESSECMTEEIIELGLHESWNSFCNNDEE